MVIVIVLLLLVAYIYIAKNPTVLEKIPGKQPEPTPTTPIIITGDTIKVAAFNLQIFGTTKADKPEVMKVLSKTIRNYDVIAVQEIRDSSQTALPLLRDAVNSRGSPQYDYVVSERLGRTASKEQYAYIYNTQTMQVMGTPYTYPDSTDMFQREPYVSEF